jgi:acylglycerol lipase
MKHREMQFPGCGDVPLFAQAWLPESAARAIVVIGHGLAEHSGRYSALAARLVELEFAVYALDQRGHGRSGGPRCNIERFDYLVSDLGVFVGRAQRQHPGAPVMLLGHSMGGAVALGCALKYQEALSALVLSAPALAIGTAAPVFRRLIVNAMSVLAPNRGVLTLPAAAISRDPDVVRRYQSDPLVFRGEIPARTVAELLKAMEHLQQHGHDLTLPVLIQHGSADSLVPLSAVQSTYQHLGQPRRRTVQVYEGLYHEVYNEPERDRVIRDLESWLTS